VWSFHSPTKIFFGEHVLDKEKHSLALLGKRCLVVTGRTSSKTNGSLQELLEALESLDIEYVIWDQIGENPTFEQIEEAVEMTRKEKTDFVVGVGGGSPMDASKAIAVLLKNQNLNVEDLYRSETYSEALPICTVPTTSGTGSETTQYSVLTDREGFKKGLSSTAIFPRFSFVDYRYTVTMSEELTRATGLDALSHAVEGFISKRSSLISDAIALKSIEIIRDYLPRVLSEPNNKEFRENMMIASTMAGIVISQTGTTMAHALGYPLSTFKSVKHGEANAAFLHNVVELAREEVPQKVEMLYRVLQSDISEFLLKVGFHVQVKLNEDEIKTWTKRALRASHMKSTPGTYTEELILKMYREVGRH